MMLELQTVTTLYPMVMQRLEMLEVGGFVVMEIMATLKWGLLDMMEVTSHSSIWAIIPIDSLAWNILWTTHAFPKDQPG